MQLLPRGYHVSPENRIKKQIAGTSNWQIYQTNIDTYVLAVKPDLYNLWISKCFLPTGIFVNDTNLDLWLYQSSGDYLISSMESGPYPNDDKQIEAFSLAFKTASTLFDNATLYNAIYIEEYSFILPVSFEENNYANGIVYGKWLTGGVKVSIESFDRISKILSWLPRESLYKYAAMAGFNIPQIPEDKPDVKKDSHVNIVSVSSNDLSTSKGNITEGGFRLIGRPALEAFFNDNIIDVVLNKDRYQQMGIPFPGATILHGPPGCGKTYAVEMLSDFLGWKRFDIDSNSIASSYIHDTSKKISEVFRAAINAAPSIVVIDEMEAFLSNRNISGASGMHHMEEVAEFLRRIPEAISKGVLVFAMTNLLDAIDPAILRRGRFDYIVEVKMATAEEIEALLLAKFKDLPIQDSVDAKTIAASLSEHPMSDITFVLREAGRIAVKKDLNSISAECFSDALNMLPKKKERPRIGFGN